MPPCLACAAARQPSGGTQTSPPSHRDACEANVRRRTVQRSRAPLVAHSIVHSSLSLLSLSLSRCQ
eukprot:14027041-Alexandrium_andersonii.AAC.1